MTTALSIAIAMVAALLVYSFGRVMRSPLRRWRRHHMIICVEKPDDAEDGAWRIYKSDDSYGDPPRRYVTLEQCLADRLGTGGTISSQPLRLTADQ